MSYDSFRTDDKDWLWFKSHRRQFKKKKKKNCCTDQCLLQRDAWYKLSQLAQLNTPLTGDHYVVLNRYHQAVSMEPNYPSTTGCSSRIIWCVLGVKFSKTCLQSILATSKEWCGLHLCPTWAHSNMVGVGGGRGVVFLFTHKIYNVKELGTVIKMRWLEISPRIFRPLIESMLKLLHFAGMVRLLPNT